jgi:TolB-like protein
MKKLVLMLPLLGLTACSSLVHYGGSQTAPPAAQRVVLAPFVNATENPHAARAMNRLAATALLERGLPLFQTEDLLARDPEQNASLDSTNALNSARSAGAVFVIAGTIHEYRYKTDLKGNPAVGVTLRLVDVKDGRTVWQGSSAKVGHGYSSLTGTAHKALDELIAKIPLLKAQK